MAVSAAALPWPAGQEEDRRCPLGKRKTGVEDAPSAVEIMQELSDDMQTACDKKDSTAADRIYARFLSQLETDGWTGDTRDATRVSPPPENGEWTRPGPHVNAGEYLNT